MAVQGLGDLRLPDPDKDRRCGKTDGLRGLSRDGSLAGTKVHRSRRSLALPHRRWVYLRDDLRIPDTGVYTQRQQPGADAAGCVLPARKAL